MTVENSLLPLKEYYFHNPDKFDPQDANLMDKAMQYSERKEQKQERFAEDNRRDRKLAGIFKEV